jgi:hypothetical protein
MRIQNFDKIKEQLGNIFLYVRREKMMNNKSILFVALFFFLLLSGRSEPAETKGKVLPPEEGLRQVRVKNVILYPRIRQPIVFLEEVQGKRIIPIWIGPAEAQAILLEMREIVPPRPMTHDLLRNIIGGLKGRVDRIEITEVKGGTFYAQIILKSSGGSFAIDSRPSDALALALRTRSPIYARKAVLTAGIALTPELKLFRSERVGLVLQKMSLSLARFFGGGKEGGLLVSQVSKETPASRGGIRRGDVIYEIEGETISTLDAFEREYNKHRNGMELSIRRGTNGEDIRLQIEFLPISEEGSK